MPSYEILTDDQVLSASDDALAYTVAVLRGEQHRRALENNDVTAITEEAFATWAFTRTGTSALPRLVNGLLVCPGYKAEKSASSHDCSFVSVEGTWIWEYPEVVFDDVRAGEGRKKVRQSITVIPAHEGMEFDVVTSSARGGGCRMKSAQSFIVNGEALSETKRRVRGADEHR
jgi:hypothetical protein